VKKTTVIVLPIIVRDFVLNILRWYCLWFTLCIQTKLANTRCLIALQAYR